MKSISWWVLFGLFGQVVFALRFVIQWIASEKKKESYILPYFCNLSLMGPFILLPYAIHRNVQESILDQSTGFIVYFRIPMLIHQKKVEPVQTGSPPIDALNQKIRV